MMRIVPHFSAEGLSNVYLIADSERNGIIVDPANVDGKLLEGIERICSRLVGVLITHRHQSHTAGLGTLMKIYSPVVYAWENSINGFEAETFRDGETKRIGNLSVTAIHVPGHSTDSLVYRIDSVLFTGDTIYSGSIAMTHSFVERALLIRSIEEKIMVLEENTLLYPGHGTLSKIRIEKMLNQDLLQFESEVKAARASEGIFL